MDLERKDSAADDSPTSQMPHQVLNIARCAYVRPETVAIGYNWIAKKENMKRLN